MATFRHEGQYVDYTPGSAVSAGDVVVQGSLVGIATKAIAANVQGALCLRGVFDIAKATTSGSAITAGAKLYWDAGNEIVTTTAGSNKAIGYAAEAATASATTCRVVVCQTN